MNVDMALGHSQGYKAATREPGTIVVTQEEFIGITGPDSAVGMLSSV